MRVLVVQSMYIIHLREKKKKKPNSLNSIYFALTSKESYIVGKGTHVFVEF